MEKKMEQLITLKANKVYKTRHDWVRRVIEFWPYYPSYMNKPESSQENEMHIILGFWRCPWRWGCPWCNGYRHLDSFCDGRQVAVYWCFVECCRQACLILLATFLCSCRLASSPAVLLASKWCIHTAVSTRPLLGRNCVLFYRSGLISIWLIAYR